MINYRIKFEKKYLKLKLTNFCERSKSLLFKVYKNKIWKSPKEKKKQKKL